MHQWSIIQLNASVAQTVISVFYSVCIRVKPQRWMTYVSINTSRDSLLLLLDLNAAFDRTDYDMLLTSLTLR